MMIKRNNKTDARPGEKGARAFRRSFGMVALSVLAAVAVALFGAAPAFADTTTSGPAIEKKVVENDEHTGGTISLGVTGAASSTTTHTNANVIFVVDTSGSMAETTGAYRLQASNDGAYDDKGNDLYYEYTYDDYGEEQEYYYRVAEYPHSDTGIVYTKNANTNEYDKYTGTRYDKVGTTRLDAAKSAVESAASTILGQKNTKVSLVKFSTNATPVLNPIDKLDSINDKVSKLVADGGTNWEASLTATKKLINNDSNTKNYVIFVSDGGPTFRDHANGYERDYNKRYGVYGNGNSDPRNRNFNAANSVAKELTNSGVALYNINAFGGDANMRSLGSPKSKYFNANDPVALQTALSQIAQDIVNAHSYRNVVLTDTISDAVTATTTSGNLDASSVRVKVTDKGGRDVTPKQNTEGKYTYKAGDEPKTFNAPTVVNGKTVKWDLGDDYVLEDGWTYTASFDVLFTQGTLNNAAALLNDKPVSDSNLYVGKDGNVYANTNTDSGNGVSYKEQTTVDNEPKEADGSANFDRPSLPVPVASNLTISKKVSGNAANTSEEYNFVLSNSKLAGKSYGNGSDAVTFDRNGNYKFKLSNGHSKAVSGIPVGTEMSVKETGLSGNAKTSTTAKVNGGDETTVKAESNNATETDLVPVKVTAQAYTLKDGKLVAPTNANTVEFTNNSELIPATGIKIDPLPMAALLGVAVAGGVAVAAGARKNHGREE